jgi:hypothetical protein
MLYLWAIELSANLAQQAEQWSWSQVSLLRAYLRNWSRTPLRWLAFSMRHCFGFSGFTLTTIDSIDEVVTG